MQTNALTDFITGLTSARHAEGVWQAATAYFGSLGFERAYYGVAHRGAATTPQMLYVTDTLINWQQSYVAHEDARRDPLFNYTDQMPSTFLTGRSFAGDYPFLTPADMEVIERGAEFGLHSGAAMIMPHRNGRSVGGWHFISDLRGEGFLAQFRRHRSLLEVASAFAHREIERHGTAAPSPLRLTAREAECLKWLASGLRTEQIAAAMGLRPVTVDLHLRNARSRLGARTREQALAIALAERLIEI